MCREYISPTWVIFATLYHPGGDINSQHMLTSCKQKSLANCMWDHELRSGLTHNLQTLSAIVIVTWDPMRAYNVQAHCTALMSVSCYNHSLLEMHVHFMCMLLDATYRWHYSNMHIKCACISSHAKPWILMSNGLGFAQCCSWIHGLCMPSLLSPN